LEDLLVSEKAKVLSAKPRILVLFGNIPLLGNERANIETLAQLQEQGAAVLFLIRREWTRDYIQKELRRRNLPFATTPFFKAVRFGVGLKAWLRNFGAIIAGSWVLLRRIRKFRATHLHVGSVAWMLNFFPALMLTRTPLVFRAGELPPRHHLLWRWVWWYTCQRAVVFVCDSYFIRDQIIALGAPAERCRVIYAPAPKRSPAGLLGAAKTEELLTVLYVGQITAGKGIDLLVAVAQRLIREYSVRFVIAGDYSWQNPLGQKLVAEIRNLGIQDRIVFTGYVEDIGRLYAQAHLHVAPSVSEEAYGLTVVEAKEHGLPSIVFPTGGLKELIEHDYDGWICENRNSQSLEYALRQYLTEPSRLATQGQRARGSLSARLQVHEFGYKWAQVYGIFANDESSGIPKRSAGRYEAHANLPPTRA
jgi:glycosyltransferase involved in cell wall biosynthesis